MTKTPDNHVLSSKLATPAPGTPPEGPPAATEYPRMLVHKDSKPGNLITKEVKNAEEAAALGGDYVPLSELDIETAPAAGTVPAKTPPKKSEKDDKEPYGD